MTRETKPDSSTPGPPHPVHPVLRELRRAYLVQKAQTDKYRADMDRALDDLAEDEKGGDQCDSR